MTVEELDALPVVFSFETACRALSVGRNQGYRLLKQGQFPVRVLRLCGRYRVTKFDLLAYLGADTQEVPPQPGNAPGQQAPARLLRPVRSAAER